MECDLAVKTAWGLLRHLHIQILQSLGAIVKRRLQRNMGLFKKFYDSACVTNWDKPGWEVTLRLQEQLDYRHHDIRFIHGQFQRQRIAGGLTTKGIMFLLPIFFHLYLAGIIKELCIGHLAC